MTGELDVPERFDSESFRAGYAQAMTHIGHMALSGADGMRPDPVEDSDSSTDEGSCQTCDAPLLDSMGADESDHSPSGYVCPSCDL